MEMTVKKHKDAIKNLREKLKTLAEVMPKLRAEILTLKFDAEGKRRPETGPQRYLMRLGYKEQVRPNIRATRSPLQAHRAQGRPLHVQHRQPPKQCPVGDPRGHRGRPSPAV